MKKTSLQTIASYINDHNISELANVYDEIVAELSKGEAKAKANRELYAEAHDVVIGALPTDTPVTISELYDEVADFLPDSFSKGKVQYAITRLWTSEVVKHEGKTNGYTRKV